MLTILISVWLNLPMRHCAIYCYQAQLLNFVLSHGARSAFFVRHIFSCVWFVCKEYKWICECMQITAPTYNMIRYNKRLHIMKWLLWQKIRYIYIYIYIHIYEIQYSSKVAYYITVSLFVSNRWRFKQWKSYPSARHERSCRAQQTCNKYM